MSFCEFIEVVFKTTTKCGGTQSQQIVSDEVRYGQLEAPSLREEDQDTAMAWNGQSEETLIVQGEDVNSEDELVVQGEDDELAVQEEDVINTEVGLHHDHHIPTKPAVTNNTDQMSEITSVTDSISESDMETDPMGVEVFSEETSLPEQFVRTTSIAWGAGAKVDIREQIAAQIEKEEETHVKKSRNDQKTEECFRELQRRDECMKQAYEEIMKKRLEKEKRKGRRQMRKIFQKHMERVPNYQDEERQDVGCSMSTEGLSMYTEGRSISMSTAGRSRSLEWQRSLPEQENGRDNNESAPKRKIQMLLGTMRKRGDGMRFGISRSGKSLVQGHYRQ